MDMANSLASLIVVLAILIILFFVCRELFCWYWKINERLKEQKKTNLLLAELLKSTGEKGNSAARKIMDDTIQSPQKITSWEELNKKK